MTYTEKLARLLYRGLCIFALLYFTVALYKLLGGNMDSTDESPMNRSNMYLHTDNLTGLQYLSSPYGGMTPRLMIDENGNTFHMTIKDDK